MALGRKNYLFVGSENAGKVAAIAYTLIETAKLNHCPAGDFAWQNLPRGGVDPQAGLIWGLALIADHKVTKLDELFPWRYVAQAAQQAASVQRQSTFTGRSRINQDSLVLAAEQGTSPEGLKEAEQIFA